MHSVQSLYLALMLTCNLVRFGSSVNTLQCLVYGGMADRYQRFGAVYCLVFAEEFLTYPHHRAPVTNLTRFGPSCATSAITASE